MPKRVAEAFSFSELKIEEIINFFTQSPTKIFCISVFNVGGCQASCSTFISFLTSDPSKKMSLKKPQNLKKMLRKSPASNAWAATFKNT